ncbi:class I SAM-dependent methyltransferase [Mucilaginibacter sp. FT3.2]|uniref:class I SAM-dependent methyltransferase n=1 Tax=Mucilaginibacter sp. FT3.2 TaxID=2723090 RepID=UPI00161458B7|nr:class I SAM-dependent methyltransferase [Mucilaginibacter sp. FT3.2]MBB6233564.1 ubiquinone/menaquinone biosynthesis C-methylase UbiE [Mucilaginibacter sp. FT3.2]
MLATIKNYIKSKVSPNIVTEKNAVEAYDLWATDYDMQPGNLMLHLDEKLFATLLKGLEIKGKQVADIGCGTGRQWPALFNKQPAGLTGFDVSGGMLKKLKEKYPSASISQITDNLFADTPDASFDVIVSTLTVAHIADIEEALQAWSRLLKPGGEIIITDFHPHTLAFGGKRTFTHDNTLMAVHNYVHPIYSIKEVLLKNNFYLVTQEEIKIDESMKPFYADANAMHVYEKYYGFPIIYGIHLKRN